MADVRISINGSQGQWQIEKILTDMDILQKLIENLNDVYQKPLVNKVFSRENIYALLLCLMILALIILTADKAPQWIYQGF